MADAARDIPRMSASDYLALERQSPSRHEFVNGVVYAMAGASKRHDAIAQSVLTALDARLSRPCFPFSSDVKVHIRSTPDECFYYPDASVVCSDLDTDPHLVKLPSLIVEVLSPTTRQDDIRIKLPEYRKIASLDAILYIDPEDKTVHLETRDPTRGWTVTTPEVGESVTLPLHGIVLEWDDIFSRD